MKEKTGYASIDKPWLQYYDEDAYDKALSTPKDISVWDFYRPLLLEKNNIPALQYFNRTYSREEFVQLVENWARTFRAMGVGEDEMIPVYGSYSPDICAIFFALNAIGAHPYFLKLDITPEAMIKETEGSKIAIVHDALWNDVASKVFNRDQFKKVIISGTADSMMFPMKEVVQLKNFIDRKKSNLSIPNNSKFVWADEARNVGNYYTGNYAAKFKEDRIALITSSSGTTSSLVKGIMDSNESILANVIGTSLSKPNYIEGKKALASLPPTASTSINCLFLLPLYRGMTVVIDPRISEDIYYKQITEYKPSVTITTGSYTEELYRRFENDIKHGKKPDLSFADFFIIGGSGTTPDKLKRMNEINKMCGAPNGLVVGYGSSELFGVVTVDKPSVENENAKNVNVTDVGLPIAGATIGIFDENGNELTYGNRGEIWLTGPSLMHGYFGKPELSKEVIKDGWFKSGDIGMMDENGFLYVYGRKKDSIIVNNERVFLFDIANTLRSVYDLEDCMAEAKKLDNGDISIVIYFVQKESRRIDSKDICLAMDETVKGFNVKISGYKEHSIALPSSPTTLKPRTRDLDGFIKYIDDNKYDVSYDLTDVDDVVHMNINVVEKDKIRKKIKLC